MQCFLIKLFSRILLFLVLGCGVFTAPGQTTAGSIDSLMNALAKRGQFNGSILVSAQGKTLYRNAFGTDTSRKKFTPETISEIASVSKGFTAMAIMMLAEQGKLSYDDPIERYLPELGPVSIGVTIRHLLTHSSGLPDVGDLGIDNSKLSNSIAIEALQKLKANLHVPGQKYLYSNTGYLLLGSIVERVSGEKFKDFLREHIFIPLSMSSTSLPGEPAGMGNILSNVDDLLKWEESFYTEKLIHKSSIDTAFTPYPVKEGTSSYGFGWNITSLNGEKFVWHTGNTNFFRAFIGRLLPERIAVIILTQSEEDSKRMEINEAIVNIIQGKPYRLPRIPIVKIVFTEIKSDGIEKGIALYGNLKTNEFTKYDFSENQLNALGYKLLGSKMKTEAVRIFELYATEYPSSSNAFDSLGDAYNQSGDTASAIKSYEKALRLDPTILNSINMLKRLKQ
jgi:CubicO group peptidase (beta-lactamase class C family)